jgi:hypothetical protein
MAPLPLSRSGRPVQSFLSVLGRVRETRLTAALAYLIARFPNEFLPLIAHDEKGDYEISVEETDEGDRYDVLVKGGKYPIVLEGKTGAHQSHRQLLRYVETVRRKYKRRPGLVIVDVGSRKSQGLSQETEELKPKVTWIRYVTWSDVAEVCRGIVRRRKPFYDDRIAAAVTADLLTHLEENHMLTTERPEIYLRELSTADSIRLYFRHNLYQSDPKWLRSAQGNLYFAPYFTQQTAKKLTNENLVPIQPGISYISKIRDLQVVQTRNVFAQLQHWGIEDGKQVAKLVQHEHRLREVLLLFLGEPQLLFPSPVTKAKLGRSETRKKFTQGALGARSCSLEELLGASQV